jgi:hypothetical protein
VDLTDNKVMCEVCWAPTIQQDFGLCVSCRAPMHPECRAERQTCPTFGCQGMTLMTGKEYLAGAGRDLPEDAEARVKVLTARRHSLRDEYSQANCWMLVAGAVFFGAGAVFSAVVGVTNFGPVGLFWLALAVTTAITCGLVYLQSTTRHLLSRIALIDLELGHLGRSWDGTPKAGAPAVKAA